MENLIGKKFNLLTVIDGPIKKSRKIYWKCKCDCGNIKEIRSDELKNGAIKSCGCYKNKIFIENNKKRQTIDLTNKRFGKLIAKEPTLNRKNGRVIWKCICDCGNIFFADTHSLQQGKVLSCGCLKSKGELKITTLLQQNNIQYVKEKTFENCKFLDNNYFARFDFFIENNYLIEYDGEQHFYYKNSKNTWNTKENYLKVKEHDEYKNKWCKQNNIPLIRIPYTHFNELCIEDLLLETSLFRVV